MCKVPCALGRLGRLALAAVLVAACGSSKTKLTGHAFDPADALTTDGSYRHLYSGFLDFTALAEKGQPDVNSGTVELDYLVKGAEAATDLSDAAETQTVRVAPGDPNINDSPDPKTWPETALFLAHPDLANNVGTLEYVDLSPVKGWKAVDLPQGAGVPAEGFWYGAKGDEILFIANFDSTDDTGDLFWSNGTQSLQLGVGVPPRAVIFSADRTLALVGLVQGTSCDDSGNCTYDASVAHPKGNLVAIDLKTGSKTTIASSVELYGIGTDLDFSLSAGGTLAAYVTSDGKVMAQPTGGGEPTVIAASGSAPSVSPDGKTVVYYSGDALYAWAKGVPTLLMPAPDSVRPEFSPDNKWVIAFGDMSFSAGAVGTAQIISALGDQDPVSLGSDVGWDTVRFGPIDPKTKANSAMTVVSDLTSMNGMPLYSGAGNLQFGVPGLKPTQIATRIRADDVALVDPNDATDQNSHFAYIASDGAGITGGNVYVTRPGGAAPLKLGVNATPGSLFTPHTVPGISALLWMVPVGAPDPAKADLIDRQYPDCVLWGSTPAGPAKVVQHGEANVIQALFARDGRILVLVATDSDPSKTAPKDAGIWSLPAPK